MKNPSYILVSLGRCGTSLMHQLINSHTQLYLSDECHWFPPSLEGGLYYHRFAEVNDVSVQSISPDSRWWSALRALHAELFAPYANKRWGLQFIGKQNLNHLEQLLQLYPDANVVFLKRDPRDLYISLLRTGIGQRTAANDLCVALRLIRDLGRRCFELSYEELCLEPERVITALCEFIGVMPEPDMINVLEQPISHAEQSALERRLDGKVTVNSQVTSRWNRCLSAEELVMLNDQAAQIAELSYPTISGQGWLGTTHPIDPTSCTPLGLSVDYASEILNERGGYRYAYELRSVGVVGLAGAEPVSLSFEDKEWMWRRSNDLPLALIDFRQQSPKRVKRYQHKNAKPVFSLHEVFERVKVNKVWLYGAGTETEHFLSATHLQCLVNVAGIIDREPLTATAFGIPVVALGRVVPEKDEVVLIPSVRHYASARRVLESLGYEYGCNLFLVQ